MQTEHKLTKFLVALTGAGKDLVACATGIQVLFPARERHYPARGAAEQPGVTDRGARCSAPARSTARAHARLWHCTALS